MVLDQMMASGVNTPATSSVGRLFDAASALLGVCTENTYHAQAPMELEALARLETAVSPGPLPTIGKDEYGRWLVRGRDMLLSLLESRRGGVSAGQCAAGFHETLSLVVAEVCGRMRTERGMETVALSGGVFLNALLLESTVRRLEKSGFEVLLNTHVPAGDGGISLGQAAVAAWRNTCV